MRLRLGFILLVPGLLALGACITPAPKADSILKPSQMSPDSVAVEIFFIRVPLGDAEVNGKLWNEIDEQHLPAELRQRLAKNGFRAGLVAGQVPATLTKLLDLQEKAPAASEPQKTDLGKMEKEPRVVLRHLQTRAGHRNEVIASGVYDQLPILLSENGELHGKTYTQAQGVLAMNAFPQSDGRVRLELLPELHHDQSRQQWVGDQAMWRLEAGRPKRTFDDMRIPAVLNAGSMLVLTSQPNRPGSLGHYFFTEGDENHQEQKLVVIRLCQTQHDDLIAPPTISLGE